MSDDFTANRFRWLEQVAGDNDLPAAAKSLAIMLSSKYLNRRNGAAWPAVETLALDLNITGRGVQKAYHWLVKKGHLDVEMGGGRRKPNVYRPASKPTTNGEPAFTLSGHDTVNQRSPFQTAKNPERVNQRARKGEPAGQERVNCSSPEPTEGTYRKNLLNKTVHRLVGDACDELPQNVSLKNQKAFIERLYREAPEEAIEMLVELGEESRFEAAALKAYNKVRFDEDGFFARMQTLNVEERSLTEIFSFLNGEHIKLLPPAAVLLRHKPIIVELANGKLHRSNGASFLSDFAKLQKRYPNTSGKPDEARDAFHELVTEFPRWQTELVEAFAHEEYHAKVRKLGWSLRLFLRRFREQQTGKERGK